MFEYICLDRNGNVSFESDQNVMFSSEIVVQIDTYNELLTVVKDRSSQNLHVSVKKLKYLSEMFAHSIPVDMDATLPPLTYYELVSEEVSKHITQLPKDFDSSWLDNFNHRFM